MSRAHSKPAWSHIPSYLLSPAFAGRSQLRWSSSDARSSPSNTSQTKSHDLESDDVEKSNSSFAFGFQSLTGLFEQSPKQARYSRPREDQAETLSSSPPTNSDKARASAMKKDNADQSFFRYYSPVMGTRPELSPRDVVPPSDSYVPEPQPTTGNAAAAISTANEDTREEAKAADVGRSVAKKSTTVRKTNKAPPIRHSGRSPWRIQHSDARRTPNAFGSRSERDNTLALRRQSRVSMPWGLTPEVTNTGKSRTDLLSAKPDSNGSRAEIVKARETVDSSPPRDRKALSHVTSSGEARMVDVGQKPASRRVAIAIACVRFSNSVPFRLIYENDNKKGDVLGAARVAGIMAAKRTADLIPLCHPIAISKVEVDVKLDAPGASASEKRRKDRGYVSIQALVESVGPTGVEMEALTAASGAALTVYDMCKAVDRDMTISNHRVVYKSGGRSGLHFESQWVKEVGNDFFFNRNLKFRTNSTGSGNEDGGEA